MINAWFLDAETYFDEKKILKISTFQKQASNDFKTSRYEKRYVSLHEYSLKQFYAKKKFHLLKILYFAQKCFSIAQTHFYKSKPHFFKLKFHKISKFSNLFWNCFKCCPAIKGSYYDVKEQNKIFHLKKKSNFQNFHFDQCMVFRRWKRILTKTKFLKFRPSKNRLRMISKLLDTKKIRFSALIQFKTLPFKKNFIF